MEESVNPHSNQYRLAVFCFERVCLSLCPMACLSLMHTLLSIGEFESLIIYKQTHTHTFHIFISSRFILIRFGRDSMYEPVSFLYILVWR